MYSYLSEGHERKVKGKQSCLGFERESPNPLNTTITVTSRALPQMHERCYKENVQFSVIVKYCR